MAALDIIYNSIKEHGWTITGTVTKDGMPYCYTTGLMEFVDHPEILIVGIGHQTLGHFIHTIVQEIQKGQKFNDGDLSSDIGAGPNGEEMFCKFVDVTLHNKIKYLCQSYYYYEENDFPCLQMYWPDREGKFPDDPEYNHHRQIFDA